MIYTLKIRRTILDEGTVDIEADSLKEAKRKYFEPKWNEDLIFDDEIDWEECNRQYEIIYATKKEG